MSDLHHVSDAGPKISIVVRAYNEERFIGRLFAGLALQSRRDFEVVLVDSGSTDDTVAIAVAHGARIIEIPKAEFSFGRSLNIGCEAARGDILVFVSAHVYPARVDWLERMVEPFDDDRVGLVYGMQRGNEITKFSERQIFVKWFPDEPAPRQSSYFCNNANCAIRRSLWESFPYDETLTGLEDIAWSKQLKRGGMQITYANEAEVIHVHDESWGRVRNRYRREAMALRSIEPGLRFSFLDFATLTMRTVFADSRQAARQQVLRRELGGILLFRFNQFWGTYLGHRFQTEVTSEIKNRFYFPPAVGTPNGHPETETTVANEARARILYDDGAPSVPARAASPSVSKVSTSA
ncbi:glycosyltransferase [Bauldia litoralis]|uniref:Glycosyl transferase family 2 n=1 Tax=Bauldia litoralis TaxID=665467 RepID=A0A1G6AC64_9HYPH|nr:glycosyltransferase family 2 protein [Bauldia litoralis]SDB05643.1 Glycosyl transferase family 2 [Bauldia litoralis]